MKNIYRLLAQITYLRKQIVLKKCNDYLGIDFTPADVIPDEYGCMEAVTTILVECGIFPKMIPGTATVYEGMLARKYKGWYPTKDPRPGDVAIAPTGYGYPGTIGHTWIVGNNGVWYSNNSRDGKWLALYTQKTAYQKYTIEKGIPIYYFTYISVL